MGIKNHVYGASTLTRRGRMTRWPGGEGKDLPGTSTRERVDHHKSEPGGRNEYECHESMYTKKERMGRYHIMRIEDGLSALVCNSGGAFGSASKDR